MLNRFSPSRAIVDRREPQHQRQDRRQDRHQGSGHFHLNFESNSMENMPM